MCGRYTLKAELAKLQRRFGFVERPNLEPRYNIAPTQTVPVIRAKADGPGVELAQVAWGLIPFWSKELKSPYSTINAKAETVDTAASYREPFRIRRCLVLADGFYEWAGPKGEKQPYYFRLKNGEAFAFAGLWDRWNGPEGPHESCTLITTTPNDLVRPIHNRMPVILAPEDEAAWLDPAVGGKDLLRPCPDNWLECYPVGKAVGNVKNHGPELVEPLALAWDTYRGDRNERSYPN